MASNQTNFSGSEQWWSIAIDHGLVVFVIRIVNANCTCDT